MATLTRRQKWLAIAVATIVVAGIACFHTTPMRPSPQQARVALAEAGLCSPNDPITEQDGKTLIGAYTCDLQAGTWRIDYLRTGHGGLVGVFERSLWSSCKAKTTSVISVCF
jgi:hypothetical protein